jgi:hypothetical protein
VNRPRVPIVLGGSVEDLYECALWNKRGVVVRARRVQITEGAFSGQYGHLHSLIAEGWKVRLDSGRMVVCDFEGGGK